MILNQLKYRTLCYAGVRQEKQISHFKERGNRAKQSSDLPTPVAWEGLKWLLCCQPLQPLFSASCSYCFELHCQWQGHFLKKKIKKISNNNSLISLIWTGHKDMKNEIELSGTLFSVATDRKKSAKKKIKMRLKIFFLMSFESNRSK